MKIIFFCNDNDSLILILWIFYVSRLPAKRAIRLRRQFRPPLLPFHLQSGLSHKHQAVALGRKVGVEEVVSTRRVAQVVAIEVDVAATGGTISSPLSRRRDDIWSS